MKKIKTQKGITLIALIITIIVMLILVAVTVTVALNGGLFKTAKEATSQTEIEKEKELLLEEVMGAIGKNGKVDFDKLETTFEDTGTENGEFFVITESGRKYTITERGSITLLSDEGGGETPPTGGEEPEEPVEPGTGETLEAGLYAPDGTLIASWEELTSGDSPIIPVADDVIGRVSNTLSGNLVISNDIKSISEISFNQCRGLTSVIIPDSVTSIGDSAFSWCEWLTSIEIPNSVVSMGSGVFYGCSRLNQINVKEGNANYSSDNGILYNKDKTTLIQYPIGKAESNFTIPGTVTNIGNSAFDMCTNLTTVTIPNGVKSIGAWAFSNSGLTTVTIPSTVTSIGEAAFWACLSLTEVVILDGITSISDCAFYGCEGLTAVTIPDSVTSISLGAFFECTSLTAKILGSNVEVGGDAFYDVPTVYYAGYVEGADYSSWGATSVQAIPSGI